MIYPWVLESPLTLLVQDFLCENLLGCGQHRHEFSDTGSRSMKDDVRDRFCDPELHLRPDPEPVQEEREHIEGQKRTAEDSGHSRPFLRFFRIAEVLQNLTTETFAVLARERVCVGARDAPDRTAFRAPIPPGFRTTIPPYGGNWGLTG